MRAPARAPMRLPSRAPAELHHGSVDTGGSSVGDRGGARDVRGHPGPPGLAGRAHHGRAPRTALPGRPRPSPCRRRHGPDRRSSLRGRGLPCGHRRPAGGGATRRRRGGPEPRRRAAYRPPPGLVELVKARDGRCRFPGCTVSAVFCDLDHVRPWPSGPTQADQPDVPVPSSPPDQADRAMAGAHRARRLRHLDRPHRATAHDPARRLPPGCTRGRARAEARRRADGAPWRRDKASATATTSIADHRARARPAGQRPRPVDEVGVLWSAWEDELTHHLATRRARPSPPADRAAGRAARGQRPQPPSALPPRPDLARRGRRRWDAAPRPATSAGRLPRVAEAAAAGGPRRWTASVLTRIAWRSWPLCDRDCPGSGDRASAPRRPGRRVASTRDRAAHARAGGAAASGTRPTTRATSPGVPDLTYAPKPDGRPDPGEIVWTWVPYEEDHRQGKDRPVLLVGRDGPWLLALMLTSKDHDRDHAQEARQGRHWQDIGSGRLGQQGPPQRGAGRPHPAGGSRGGAARGCRARPRAVRPGGVGCPRRYHWLTASARPAAAAVAPPPEA